MMKEIPKGWIISTLGEVCSKPQYGYTTGSANSGTLHLLRTTDITSGIINWKTVPFCSENPKDVEKYLLQSGDIVISRAGSVGVSYLLKDTKKAVFASYLIRFKPLINEEFFKYFLDTSYYWQQISENKLGVAVPNVNATKLQTINLPVPPIDEQKRIVAKIEELFSELDKGLENLKKGQELLKMHQQSIIDSAATGELLVSLGLLKTQFDDSYKTELSKVIIEHGQGWSPKCLNEPSTNESDWAVIKTTAIQSNEFLQNENKLLPTHLKPKLHLEIVPGDILITRAGPRNRVGIACLVRKCRKHLILCDKAYRIRVNDKFLLPEYLEMLLNSPQVINSVESLKTGINDSGVNLTQDRFLALRLIIPPLPLQQLTLQKLQEAMSTSNHLSHQVNIALEKIQIMRQCILKKAFLGKLVPQDPNDEPANVFLERIKSEQLNHSNPQKKSKKKQKVSI